MVVYSYISAKIKEKKRKIVRAETVPEITNSLSVGVPYNICLSDGRLFKNVKILGSIEGEDPGFSFANWEGLLVIKKEDEKRVFIKKTSIRFIEEI